jgi:iron complex transport system substrate-binding protein
LTSRDLPDRPIPRGALLAGRVAAVILAAVGLVSCERPAGEATAAAISVTDRAGRALELDAPARRVASLVPAATDWILAFGAADRLVVRTDHDPDLRLRDVPSVGGGLTPSVEWVAARRPDLVIAWGDGASRSTVARLEGLGIPVYVATAEGIEEALGIAADLGRLLGLESEADSVVLAVRARLRAVREAARAGPPPSVLFLIGLDPVTGAGSGTFVDELIAVAGGRNVLAGLGAGWPPLSLEEILRREPDLVLVGTTAPDPLRLIRDRPGWRSMSAVRTGRVYPVHPDLVARWGPQLPVAADTLARLIRGPRGP